MSLLEWGMPRAECRDRCTCESPMCQCGYVVLPDGRCMRCHRSSADATPKGLISAEAFDQALTAALHAGFVSILGTSPIADLVEANRAYSWPGRLDAAFGSTDPTLESLLPPEGR